jgi:hypothetical protein
VEGTVGEQHIGEVATLALLLVLMSMMRGTAMRTVKRILAPVALAVSLTAWVLAWRALLYRDLLPRADRLDLLETDSSLATAGRVAGFE